MAISKQQVQQELNRLGQNRNATDEDVANANKVGLSVFERAAAQNKGVPNNEKAPKTAAQAGQANYTKPPAPPKIVAPTNVNEAKAQQAQAIAEEAEIGSQSGIVQSLLKKALEIKKKGQPFDKRIKEEKAKVAGLDMRNYEGLSLEDTIGAMSRDLGQAQANVTYYEQQKAAEEGTIDSALAEFQNLLNTQLAAAGLRVERTTGTLNQMVDEQRYQEQLAEARRGRGGRGSASSDAEKERQAFLTDGQKQAQLLASGDLDWGQAWNYMKQKYQVPDEYNYTIDSLLGGSVKQDEYGNPVYEGWAKPGAYEERLKAEEKAKG